MLLEPAVPAVMLLEGDGPPEPVSWDDLRAIENLEQTNTGENP